MDIKATSKAYLEYLSSSGLSERTIYTYGKDLQQVCRFFGENTDMNSILVTQVGKFLKSDELLKLPNGKERAEPTVKKTIRVFTQFIKWSHEQGYMDTTPLPKSLN